MEELDNLDDAVERRLRAMGVDPDAVDKRSLEQMLRIQRSVDEEAERIAESRRIARHGMPIVRVAEMTGLSRQTIYKPLVKAYTERAIRDAGICEGADELERLRKTVAEREEAIAALVRRDGELVEAKIQLRDAKLEISALRASLADSKRTIAELRKMLDEAGKKPAGKVIAVRQAETRPRR